MHRGGESEGTRSGVGREILPLRGPVGQISYEAYIAHELKKHKMQPEFPRPTTWEELSPEERDKWSAAAAATQRKRRSEALEVKRVELETEQQAKLARANRRADDQRMRADALASDLERGRQRHSETEARLAQIKAKLDKLKSKLDKKK